MSLHIEREREECPIIWIWIWINEFGTYVKRTHPWFLTIGLINQSTADDANFVTVTAYDSYDELCDGDGGSSKADNTDTDGDDGDCDDEGDDSDAEVSVDNGYDDAEYYLLVLPSYLYNNSNSDMTMMITSIMTTYDGSDDHEDNSD